MDLVDLKVLAMAGEESCVAARILRAHDISREALATALAVEAGRRLDSEP